MNIQPTNFASSGLANWTRTFGRFSSYVNPTSSVQSILGAPTTRGVGVSADPALLQHINSLFANTPQLAGQATLAGQQTTLRGYVPQLADLLRSNALTTPVFASSGMNPQQISQVNVGSLGTQSELVLQGQVNQAAQAAQITIAGDSSGLVASSGSYTLSGNGGSTPFVLTVGESLAAVAAQVNRQSATTGVAAALQGNNLVLSSTGFGSSANVTLRPWNSSSVQGVNANQVNSFQVLSQAAGTSDNIAGTVVSSADQAQLVYNGSAGGLVAGTASFQLTGARGSTNVQLTEGETLADVAAGINRQTGGTGVIATVKGNNLFLTSDTPGAAATVQISNVQRDAQTTIDGVNSAQISNVTVSSLESGSQSVLTGQVLQSASQATVYLQGSSSGNVIDSATFNLSGALGSQQFSVTQGESLGAVASRINALTGSTGVQAQVDTNTNQLVFQSTGVGSAANVAVQLTNVTHYNDASGVNSQQLTNFQINSLATGASETLNGTVTQAASQATVYLQGSSSGNVIDSATFNLSGALGSQQFSVTQGESLGAVASRINALTGSTGVQAQVNTNTNQLVFQSTGVGSAANVAVQLTNVTHYNDASGVNSQQLTNFQINSLATGASETLSGTVTQAASQATVYLQGSSSGNVIDSNTFTVTGGLGTATVSMQQGETLSAVASRINALTSSTGVQAQVNTNTNQLVFQSTGVGSAANVAVQLANTAAKTTVSGVNAQQLTSFQVNSFTTGASETLTGSVTQAATQAQLTFAGNAQGQVHTNATFTLSGSKGSATFTTTNTQTLANLANLVNQSTATTGVQATVVGTNLQFQSVGYGSAGSVTVKASSGTFNVTGGYGNGTAVGTDALATINGQSLTGSGNSFQFSDALGSYSFTTAAGFTGALNPISVSQSNQLTGVVQTTAVSGVNGQQFTNFQAKLTNAGASQTLTGSVTQTASQAELDFTGTAGLLVNANSTFTLQGSVGSATFTTTNTQTLANLASQVNQATATTGVQAVVSGNVLKFQSVGVGSSASVSLHATNGTFNVTGGDGNGNATGTNAVATVNGQTLTGNGNWFQFSDAVGTYSFNAVAGFTGAFNPISISQVAQPANLAYTTTVSGANAQQVTNFQTSSFATGATESFTGSVTRTATQAQLTFAGNAQGQVHTNATFTLSGSKGSATFTTTNTQTLANLANLVNQSTATTGVQATVVGTNLQFQSVGYGSAGSVTVKASSGTFNVTGGYGNGTAVGTDALATINGQSLTGSGNSFQFSDALGSYSFTTAAGFTGALNPISVVSQAGSFALSGGNGNGTANGTDAKATINGQNLTGTGNSFQFSDGVGSYSFTTAAGFTGALNPISVVSQAGSFALSGGNGNGTANGTDAKATINGQSLTGSGNSFQFSDALGSYSFTTAAGFTGALNPISVVSQAGNFALSGGNGNGTANGTDAKATINGQNLTGTGNSFQFSDGVGSYSFTTAAGFTGALNPISVVSQAGSFALSGGNGNGTASGSDAIAKINGVQQTGTGNLFTVNDAEGTFQIQFAPGFQGTFDPVTIQSTQAAFNVQGGDSNGLAHGTDFSATINGVNYSGPSNSATVVTSNGKYQVAFADRFTGSFDPITVANGGKVQTAK